MKKSGTIYKVCKSIADKVFSLIALISPTMLSKIRYRMNMGKKLNLSAPEEFNEKLMWLKLNTYYMNPLVEQCADKVRVREYVIDRGCRETLIDNIGIYEKPEDIPWGELPEQFVLKCNHGAGYNILCCDKQKLNIDETCRQLRKWMKMDYSLPYAEMQYHRIKPLILCEKYLTPESGEVPDDYKVYCFDGKAECIMVCQGRDTGECRYYFFDREWNWLKWNRSAMDYQTVDCKKPVCLDRLLYYAETLSKGFPFVRMDFYVMGEKVFFGEMTFTPCGCVDQAYTEIGNRELSRRLVLPI